MGGVNLLEQSFDENLYHDVIVSLILAMESKDINMINHSKRVADMVTVFGDLMELDEKTLQEVHIAAHIHDIGKIGVPDYILNKSTALTDWDWMVIKMHTVTGADILSHSEKLEKISNIILHQHERWDGKGYPAGLCGEEIPIGSRILAVCESIDAMLCKRVYRNELKKEEAFEEIKRNRGIMYDWSIADLALANWENLLAVRKNTADK